jgi:hypothetical protein
MSSGAQRDPLSGVIRQGTKVVGSIVIPEDPEVFVREFNHCYGQLRLSVTPVDHPSKTTHSNPHTFQLPDWFRHVWHANQPKETSIDPQCDIHETKDTLADKKSNPTKDATGNSPSSVEHAEETTIPSSPSAPNNSVQKKQRPRKRK